MGMFDTFCLKGKVRAVVESVIPGVENGELQTKDLDLELVEFDLGEDLTLKVSKEPYYSNYPLVDNKPWVVGDDCQLVKDGNFTRIVESRWSCTSGSIFLSFVDNKLQYITHIHRLGWYPSPANDFIKDSIILFGQPEGDYLVIHLDHNADDNDQRAMDIYQSIITHELGDDVESTDLYKALVAHYTFRRDRDHNVKQTPDQFRAMLGLRSDALHASAKYAMKAGFTNVADDLSPMAIGSMLHRQWMKSQECGVDGVWIDHDIPVTGFDDRYPSELLHIFERSYKAVFGDYKVQHKVRPNLDFKDVKYDAYPSRGLCDNG